MNNAGLNREQGDPIRLHARGQGDRPVSHPVNSEGFEAGEASEREFWAKSTPSRDREGVGYMPSL